MRGICAEAGVSPGLLTHYFEGVDSLVVATYLAVGQQVQLSLNNAVANAAASPRARLLAYLSASFTPPIAEPSLLATWLAFWSLTKSDPRIALVHAEIYATYRAGLETLIVELSLGDHRLTAIALTALVDGLWLELSLGNAPFTADEASALAEKWLDALLSQARR